MKISELISKLQEIQAAHGDLQLAITPNAFDAPGVTTGLANRIELKEADLKGSDAKIKIVTFVRK